MKTILENSENIILEKKSKFITRIFKVDNEDSTKNIIEKTKNEEKGATHNCFAYRIWCENKIIERKSDDGEPKGTAGSPMLSVLSGENIVNVLVIITRYFGGIKLGTGGLVNIYSKSVKEVLKKCKVIDFEPTKMYKIFFSINEVSQIDFLLKNYDIKIVKKEFNEDVSFTVEMNDKKYNLLKEKEHSLNIQEIKR